MSEDLYFPQILELTNLSPENYITNTNYIGVNRNGFELTWTQDLNNTNGLLLYISWNGHFLNADSVDGNSNSVEKAVLMPDTGRYTCDTSIFSGFPQNALFSGMIIRGNIHIADESLNSNKNIKINASQIQYLDFAMIN